MGAVCHWLLYKASAKAPHLSESFLLWNTEFNEEFSPASSKNVIPTTNHILECFKDPKAMLRMHLIFHSSRCFQQCYRI